MEKASGDSSLVSPQTKWKQNFKPAMDFSTPLFCCLTQTEEWKQNLFCWNILTFFAGRDEVGLMCWGRGMNTMHLTPTAWIQYMRARGEIHCWNLYCLEWGWWGQQLAKVDGGWCRYSRVWGSQACSHVACTVLGLLVAPTRGMLSIFCNCFSISIEFFVFTTFGGAWLTRCSYVGCLEFV